MALQVDIQNEDNLSGVPSASEFQRWVEAALMEDYLDLEQTIRVVGEPESQLLNEQFRGRDAPTNVLSFPSQSDYLDYQCLGDLVICGPLVARESAEQNKSEIAHWAHLVVHGMLHLQGFDHENDADATEMENLEVEILSTLGYSNPYNVA